MKLSGEEIIGIRLVDPATHLIGRNKHFSLLPLRNKPAENHSRIVF